MSWRLAKHRYALTGNKCIKCGYLQMPPRPVCQECGGEDMEPFKFSGNGKVVSHTTIHAAPEGFERQSPYVIALIRLDEGPVISSQIVGDHAAVEIDKPVVMVFRKISEDGRSGVINYGFKFEVVE